jgi:DNA mismatch endonuclease (patch repair protein)
MDRLTKEQRSQNMAQIKSCDTKPEKLVRSLLHHIGYRFRLHVKTLPGSPDIVLPRYKTVIFVHGCFWHRHEGCPYTTTPATRTEFWAKKFAGNIQRDKAAVEALAKLGWMALVVWECELKDMDILKCRLQTVLPR